MNIVIVGGGLVGSTLAEKLSRDRHDVSLVDASAAKVRELSDSLDVDVIQGNGALAPVLRRAGIEKADLVIGTTNTDEVNMLVGLLSTQLFDVPHLVVLLRDQAHEDGFALVCKGHEGAYVSVNPEQAAVDRIAMLLEVPGALDAVSFMDDQLIVAGFRITTDSDFAGLRVSDMNLLFAGTPTLAVAIHRSDDWIIPNGAEVIEDGDIVYFAIARASLEDVLSLVGVRKDDRRDVMIAGAGAIGLELARRLEKVEGRAVIIEEDEELAQQAAERLADVMVLHGQVTDQALLEEEDIHKISTFVAVTPDHETNLVAGFLAKRLGAGRVISLVDNPALVPLIGQIGIDAIISPRVLVIGITLEHIRGGLIRSVAQLLEDRIEIVEAEALPRSQLTRGTLSEIELPKGVLIAALQRGDVMIVPRGSDRIEPGDRILLVTTTENAHNLGDFLGG